jgi:hypothetical protein
VPSRGRRAPHDGRDHLDDRNDHPTFDDHDPDTADPHGDHSHGDHACNHPDDSG